MSFGVKIRNENNVIIVDGDYRNYGVVRHGTASPEPDRGSAGYAACFITELDFSDFTKSQQVFIAPPIGWEVGIMNVFFNPDEYTIYMTSDFTLPLDWLVAEADVAENIDSSGEFGMEIYNSSGVKVFSSLQEFFNIDDVLVLVCYKDGSGIHWTQTYTLPDPPFGKRYFQVIARGRDGEFGHEWGVSITKHSETSVTITAPFARDILGIPGTPPFPINLYILTGYY